MLVFNTAYLPRQLVGCGVLEHSKWISQFSIPAPYKTRSLLVVAQNDGGGSKQKQYRVKKIQSKKGVVTKAIRLVDCVTRLSNVKEEVYSALDSFVAFDVEFPIIAVKKALTILYERKDWKRIIQITKWMFSKGQGRTVRNHYILLNALVQEGRREEAEELWMAFLSENLDNTPRVMFALMISMYEKDGDNEKMLEVFADMEELRVKPDYSTVLKIARVLKELGRVDKYERLLKKYPKPKWEYRYIKGKRVRRALELESERNVNKENSI